jgi:hypothetical protein
MCPPIVARQRANYLCAPLRNYYLFYAGHVVSRKEGKTVISSQNFLVYIKGSFCCLSVPLPNSFVFCEFRVVSRVRVRSYCRRVAPNLFVFCAVHVVSRGREITLPSVCPLILLFSVRSVSHQGGV